jgi:hypothetical protein
LAIRIDSITVPNPKKFLNLQLDFKLNDIYSLGEDIIYITDNKNDSIFIIKNFNSIIAKLKYPEKYSVSNNAPFVTIKDSTLYFLTFYSGKLFKYALGMDTVLNFIDSFYDNKFLKEVGLSVSCYPVTNTFSKQIKVINENLYFLTIPSGYNTSLEYLNGKYSNHETSQRFPLLAKFNFISKEIDTLPLSNPIITDYLKAGALSNFYVCFTDSLVIATAPVFNNLIIYNIFNKTIKYKDISSKFHKERDILTESDDVLMYYFTQPYFEQLLYNSFNHTFSQVYNLKQNKIEGKVKNIYLRPKSIIFYDNQLNKLEEIIAPDSLSGFYKFTHKNDFYYSKIPNNDSTITFYKFSVVK